MGFFSLNTFVKWINAMATKYNSHSGNDEICLGSGYIYRNNISVITLKNSGDDDKAIPVMTH